MPLSSSPAELRTLATAIVNKLTSGCCKKGLTPLAPRRVQGDLALTLMFSCDGCNKPIDIPLGVKKRLNKMTEQEATELIEQAERDGGKKPRTTTNARDEAQVRLVLGCLLTGNMYGHYERICLAMQMEPMHHDTWAGYIALIGTHISALAEESIELMRYLIVKHGECIDKMVLTNDWCGAATHRTLPHIGDEEDYCEETGELLNFVVKYPEDGEQTQALSIEDYDARRVAKVGSWYIVANVQRRARVDPDAPGGP